MVLFVMVKRKVRYPSCRCELPPNATAERPSWPRSCPGRSSRRHPVGIALFSTIAAAATAGGVSLAALSTGYSMVFFWAAGVAILIAPIALLLINIDRRKFTGTEGDAPIVHLG